MKAAVYRRYGPPTVVRVEDVPRPAPGAGEILVRVHKTTVTPADWRFRKADPWIIRLMNGWRRPTKVTVLGTELAGVVEEVGADVTRYKPGDWVFGDTSSDRFGGHAEYALVEADGAVAAVPPGVSMEQAGAVCFGGVSALVFLRDVAQLNTGERVLINGAAGGVGSFAVQLARHFGAHVTGVASGRNLELVRSLGADETIDYTANDPLGGEASYDVILDTVGLLPVSACLRALTPGGRFVPVAFGPLTMLRGLSGGVLGGPPIRCAVAKATRDRVDTLAELLHSGTIRSVVDRRYPLAEIAEAHRYVEAGHKRGAVVIDVVDE